MRAADLQTLVAPLTLDAVRRIDATAAERAALARAWFATHREELILASWPQQTRWGNAATARRTIARDLASVPRAAPGRPSYRYAWEMYRGCGKTALIRLSLLTMGITAWEAGAVLVGRNGDKANEHSTAMRSLLPERRASGIRDADYLRTPLGRLFPGVCWVGSTESWQLHVPHLPGLNDEPTVFRVWTRGIGGDLRGFLGGFDRPTALLFDDVETAASARSPPERESVWRAMTEEAAGATPEDIGPLLMMACNALAPDDAGERAERDPGWRHRRVAIWSHPPPETPLVRELEQLYRSTGGPDGAPEAKIAAVQAHPHALEVEALTTMDDPRRTVLSALCLRWSEGVRPFARNRECKRTSHGERTFDAEKFTIFRLGRDIRRLDDRPAPALVTLDVVVWLDPRFTKNATKNDFAAIVAVGRSPDGTRWTLDADLARDRGSASRARVWAMADRLLALGVDPRRLRIGYETNGGSEGTYEETFDEDIVARRKAGLFATTPIGVHSSGAKLDRIETMEDPLHTGGWLIAEHLIGSELWGQLLAVPHGSHDDGPDAMERAGHLLQEQGPSLDEWAAFLRG